MITMHGVVCEQKGWVSHSSRSKESKIKGLVDLVSGEGLFLIDGTFALHPYMMERTGRARVSLVRTLIPFMRCPLSECQPFGGLEF